MSFESNAISVDELTIAQETASWDRQRTTEELKDFVTRRIAQIATAEEVELIA